MTSKFFRRIFSSKILKIQNYMKPWLPGVRILHPELEEIYLKPY